MFVTLSFGLPLEIMIGFDWRTMNLLVAIEQQSPNIAMGVHADRDEPDIGAGDQVLKFRNNLKYSGSNQTNCSDCLFYPIKVPFAYSSACVSQQ